MFNVGRLFLKKLAVAALLAGVGIAAHAALVEVKFATGPISSLPAGSNTNASETAFLAALTANGLTPSNFGGVSGRLFYEGTTAGNGATPTTNYNGAIDALSFSVAGWFSQSLTGIGNGGDILVTNDGSAQVDVDRIVARVNCVPGVGAAGSSCVANTFNFNYSVSNAGVTWVLDEFELFLEENGSNNPLNGLALPTQAQWESSEWTVRRVDLRFNPNCDGTTAEGCGNVIERAAVTFLAVPEPGTAALAGLALLALGIARRQKARD